MRPLLPRLYATYPALRWDDYETMPQAELDALLAWMTERR